MHTNLALRNRVDFGDLSNDSLENRSKERKVDRKKIVASERGKRMPSSKQRVVSKSLRREIALQPSISRQFMVVR